MCFSLSLLRWHKDASLLLMIIYSFISFVYALTSLTPLPLCVLYLNSWRYLRGSIFLSFLVFRTSVCLRYLMCELECRYTCVCVGTDFKKGTSPDKVISLKRLSVFGRQEKSGDLQTDLACWIRLWAHSSGGSFLRAGAVNGPCTVCRHCLTEP